ncbi:hypothetical protein M8C21_015733, partial [Ambrosia artemisiifolia]
IPRHVGFHEMRYHVINFFALSILDGTPDDLKSMIVETLRKECNTNLSNNNQQAVMERLKRNDSNYEIML